MRTLSKKQDTNENSILFSIINLVSAGVLIIAILIYTFKMPYHTTNITFDKIFIHSNLREIALTIYFSCINLTNAFNFRSRFDKYF